MILLRNLNQQLKNNSESYTDSNRFTFELI